MCYLSNDVEQTGYKEYLTTWVKGIDYELSFWADFVDSLIENYKINNNNKLNYLPDDSSYIEEEFCYCHDRDNVLDVGSGAVPFYFHQLLKHKKNIDFYSVDPLAKAYKELFSIKSINVAGVAETCFVEDLSSKFSENFFDVVHMSNSLDHSFDPILALWQMLYVCNIGGYILLRHNCNEAEREKYSGFHQWNIDINRSFSIFRGKRVIDVLAELRDYVSVEKMFKTTNNGIDINFVCLKKMKKTPLLKNEHNHILLQVLLDSVNEFSLKKALNRELSDNEILVSLLKQKFDVSKHTYVYGAGKIGKRVIAILEKLGIRVRGIFDSDANRTIKGYTVRPFSRELLDNNSSIIIASKAFSTEIENFLMKNLDCNQVALIKL